MSTVLQISDPHFGTEQAPVVKALAVPGNHDIPLFDLWTRLGRPYAHYAAAFGSDLEPVHACADLMVVCPACRSTA